MDSENTSAILLFGANCSGKSTLGRLLAGKLPKCAFIEVDALHYMVVGGLVGWSSGLNPREYPDEYERQHRTSLENAGSLARRFASHGFSSVIEGLGRRCVPGSGWAEENLSPGQVHHVLLVCDERAMRDRWRRRTGQERLAMSVQSCMDWFLSRTEIFDVVFDTSCAAVEESAERLWEVLSNEEG